MKIEFPKIVKELDLSEYAPGLTQRVSVWVNPPVKMLDDLGAAFKLQMDSQGQDGQEAFLLILSAVLSQGAPETHWTVDELKKLQDDSADTDPRFFWWFQDRVAREIFEHRTGVKKD